MSARKHANNSETVKIRYRPEIDGLRAVAIIPVVLFHTGTPAFASGYIGVDIFFVISGFLITSIIQDDIDNNRFSLVAFYERRIRRILPALVLMCLVSTVFAWLWMIPREFDDFAQSLFTVSTFTSNFLFWKETGYFEPLAALKPLLHTWSLGIEEQFYLFFPLIMLFLSRWGRRAVLAYLFVAGAASFALTFWLPSVDPEANFYLLPSRAWELSAGSVIAMFSHQLAAQRQAVSHYVSLAGLSLLFLSFLLLNGGETVPGWTTLPAVLGSALILGFANAQNLAGKLLSLRFLTAIGLVSYSAYLWHQPLFAFARMRMLGVVSPSVDAALVIVTFVLAAASWRFVERPFRERRRFSRRQIFASAGIASAAIFAFGLTADLTNGPMWRNSDSRLEASMTARMRGNTGLDDSCDGQLPLPDACRTSENPEILVWGDSYAMHMVPGILASNPEAKIVQYTKSVCGPFMDIEPVNEKTRYNARWAVGCKDFNDTVEGVVKNSKSLRYAVIASPFRQYFGEGITIAKDGELVSGSADIALQELTKTIDFLRAHGITPVIFLPTPQNGNDVGVCAARAFWLHIDPSPCNIRLADARLHEPEIRAFAEKLKAEFPVIDIASFTCRSDECAVFENDVLIYRDGGHLSKEGAKYVGEKMDFYSLITSAPNR